MVSQGKVGRFVTFDAFRCLWCLRVGVSKISKCLRMLIVAKGGWVSNVRMLKRAYRRGGWVGFGKSIA